MSPNTVVLAVVGIAAIAILQIVKTIAKALAARGVSPSELARITQQLEQQAAALEDAHTALDSQASQLAELQERVDFAERLLAQARDRSALGPEKR